MNDELDERRLRRAVRSALGDFVASSPASSDPPMRGFGVGGPSRRKRPVLSLAAGITVAAGLIGIGLLANRDDGSTRTSSSDPTLAPTAAVASTDVASTVTAVEVTNPVSTTERATTTAPATSTTTEAVVAPVSIPPAGECGSATVPAGATDVQTIEGDIDGDVVDDTVTLYAIDGDWRVLVTSSVKGTASDAAISLTVSETAAVRLADIDSPAAIMVTTQGPNDLGIISNFTFLTLNPDYCVAQWIYRNAQGVDEPFQWVALEEPGHVTGMICEDDGGSRRYRLVDSEQNDDGSWRVVNRILTHNFTRAEIEFLDPDTVADSPTFTDEYGSIVGCD